MKTLIFSTIALILVGILGIGLQDVWSDDDDGMKMRSRGVAPVADPLYKEECGSCHFAYPSGLLPAASWQRIMAGLDDHFGDNAELDTQARQQITEYLTVYAADASGYRRSRAIMSSLRYNRPPPLRITETPYFRHEHREIPRRIINLPDVGSLSQCNAMHATGVQKRGHSEKVRYGSRGSAGGTTESEVDQVCIEWTVSLHEVIEEIRFPL